MTNHINYPDINGEIYCRRLHKVIELDKVGEFWKDCFQCKMFNGSYQGMGVECLWDDNIGLHVYKPSDPTRELLRVSTLLDKS